MEDRGRRKFKCYAYHLWKCEKAILISVPSIIFLHHSGREHKSVPSELTLTHKQAKKEMAIKLGWE